jgi:tetratricopeptide (TPR) repeat protein
MRLVVRGLDEERDRPQFALSDYERAIQIDPTNPYAYLALARHYAFSDPDRALEHLDQAEVLLESDDALSPRVEPHLLGIRGTALLAKGETARGEALLAQASALAPSEWADGRLSPDELK